MIAHLAAGTSAVHISTEIYSDSGSASQRMANLIAAGLRASRNAERKFVLILPTGNTSIPVYQHLAEMFRRGEISFRHAVIFNLDEYYGLGSGDPLSYSHFMYQNLIRHIDVNPENVYIPKGDISMADVGAEIAAYEQALHEAGGADLAFLGIGANGHIGFNEPGSPRNARTRLVRLHPRTRQDAIREFGSLHRVPEQGISMGVASILSSRRIVLLATGAGKAKALASAIEGPVGPSCPASFLQEHPGATVIADRDACSRLEAVRKPWLAGPVNWTPDLERAAAIYVAERAGKALLTCASEDYAAYGLIELIEQRSADRLNLEAFRYLHACITGWPGGKPLEYRRPGDIARSGDEVNPKTVLVFSPHPDDDVIGVGGTIARLVEQGHDVHIIYQTPGFRAVHDEDVDRHIAFAREALSLDDDFSNLDKRGLKAIIRRTEAVVGAAVVGVSREKLHFLNCPGYENNEFGQVDVELHSSVLKRLRPHQIYVAGDLGDPNGTHLRCLMAVQAALFKCAGDDWIDSCAMFLYRGGWDGFHPADISMAVPLSEADVLRKRQAILRHQSQKDRAMFLGDDCREFWQRAEDRTRGYAETFARLGLPRYVAIECFAFWDWQKSSDVFGLTSH